VEQLPYEQRRLQIAERERERRRALQDKKRFRSPQKRRRGTRKPQQQKTQPKRQRLKVVPQGLKNELEPQIHKYINDHLINYHDNTDFQDTKERLLRRLVREKEHIDWKKTTIVQEYGKEPTICYHYYLWNAVDYVGEKTLRESFESVKHLEEVIIGDYGSTDKTKEIALEYGFKVVDVEKTPDIMFHESKIINAIVNETDANFIFDLNINTTYPKEMDSLLKSWISNNDLVQKVLVLRGLFHEENGSASRYNSASCLIYRPYLLAARGYDERTYYGHGTTHYACCLLNDVYQLKFDNVPFDMHHKYHRHLKIPRWKGVFHFNEIPVRHDVAREFAEKLLFNFYVGFETGAKQVQNSYW